MKVRALARYVPNVGRKGAERTIDDPSARVLILLGKVERVIDPPKPKRVYKRKDIVTAPPVVVEPPVVPAIEPEIPETGMTVPEDDE